MKRKQKLENKRGITLIALIITIIVLLILAGVSIAMLAGENGIIRRAIEARDLTKESSVKELVSFLVMESFDENGEFNVDILKNAVEREGGEATENGDDVIVEIEDYEVTVDGKTGEIKGVEKAGGVRAKFETKLYTKEGGEPSAEGQEELVLTVDVTNEEEIGEGEIKVTVMAPNGENVEANASVTGDGDKSFKVDQNGEYTVAVETTVDGITKKVTKKVKVNTIIVPEFSRAYGTIDIRFINGTENTATASQTANKPVLGKNMKPVNLKSDNSGWEIVEENNWQYSYTNKAGESKWANAVVTDEKGDITGYFVWIPRYAYKITYHDGSLGGETIGYSDSRGMVRKDGEIERVYTGGNSNRRNAGENFIVHPAFTNDVNVGGWGSEVKGIWVAKYEASKETSSDGTTWSYADTESSTNGNVLTTKAGNADSTKVRLVSKPGVRSWRYINIGNIYKNAEGYNTELNSHLMKNSEWGACSYLSYSNYGIGAETPVEKSSTGYTTGGSEKEETIYTEKAGQSITGNAYGVYDMNGGAIEYVASYVNNGDSSLTNGNSFATTDKANAKSSDKAMVYKASNSETEETSDDSKKNYELSKKNMFGDATFETSISHSNLQGSWQKTCAGFPSISYPFFSRGGYYADSDSDLFHFNVANGTIYSGISFRLVLVP